MGPILSKKIVDHWQSMKSEQEKNEFWSNATKESKSYCVGNVWADEERSKPSESLSSRQSRVA